MCECLCLEMSESTGVCTADIVSTLHALKILQCVKDRCVFLTWRLLVPVFL